MSTYMFGIGVEPSPDLGEVFAIVGHVGADERRLGVAGDHPDPLGVQLGALGVVFAVEEPLGMLVQLVPALAEPVERREERAGVARVDLDRPLVTGADFPDRVELGIIDRYESAVLVAGAEAQRLVELQALGAGLEALAQPRGLAIRPARLVDTVEVDEGVGEESAGVGVVEGGDRLLEPRSPAAVEVNRGANARRVHLGEVALDSLGRERRLAASEMVVDVDDREGRLGDIGHLGDQHGPRLPVAELQFLDVALLLAQGNAGDEQRKGEEPASGSIHGTLSRGQGFRSGLPSSCPQLRRSRPVRQAC